MIDLAEGRRLLDAAYATDNNAAADAWVLWQDMNAEAMLTLLEQAREVVGEVEWSQHRDEQGEWTECPSCGGSTGHFPNCKLDALLRALTSDDAGDPLSLLEPENLP